MPRVAPPNDPYTVPPELVLGTLLQDRGVPHADQRRQRIEVEEILRRLRSQPGVVLADEVGTGKTFVALAAAYSVAAGSVRGPVVVMVPGNLVDKWEQDLKTFCELYLQDRRPVKMGDATRSESTQPSTLRYGVARHSVEFMRLMDDPPRERAHLIFLASGAMTRRQSDKWIRLALIAEALRAHGRRRRLQEVKKRIHLFLAELLKAIGDENRHELGERLWPLLLRSHPSYWKDVYNADTRTDRQLTDDPVPKSVARALGRVDLRSLADALELMPVRAVGGQRRVSERVDAARNALRTAERALWKKVLVEARWRSPLLVMDEAHHLKNPHTSLAKQLQSPDVAETLSTGDGAMGNAFDRMLFLTATPFQLGHHELVKVLERFGDVRWNDTELGERDRFKERLSELHAHLTESQRGAIALQRSWSRLRQEDCDPDIENWWERLVKSPKDALTVRQRSVLEAYEVAKQSREHAERALRPWLVRHNKGTHWVGTDIARRHRREGAAIAGATTETGLAIPAEQLLPFFLAARSVVRAGKELLGEALCSSYEAFRHTRQHRELAKDTEDEVVEEAPDLAHADWYLGEFDRALERTHGATHPKIAATVREAVDLWERGEKVLVFAFYRRTCRALRIHISQEIENRLALGASAEIERIQKRFFDDVRSPGRRALDKALERIMQARKDALDAGHVPDEQRIELVDIMRRFLRVPSTLARCFPMAEVGALEPAAAVERALSHPDGSGTSWKQKFDGFIDFLVRCSTEERRLYLDAAIRTETGHIRVEDDEEEGTGPSRSRLTLANVQVATGKTKREARGRLMRAFNTPFFPDILVCSEVMGEGVDLQRFCRHVIHHDLAWNPSTIEQRTGRIDRLGCKAEGRQPIVVYLPYLAGTADERQFRVMSHREQWFRVVMGEHEVARLITPETPDAIPLPEAISSGLSFSLGLNEA